MQLSEYGFDDLLSVFECRWLGSDCTGSGLLLELSGGVRECCGFEADVS